MGNILIVEDEVDIMAVLYDLLEDTGHHVLCASNGHEALARLSEEPVDLIITDVMMPGMNGWELVESLRKHETWCHLAVLVMSAGAGEGMAQELGVDFLAKPFDLDDFLGRIQRLLRAGEHA